MTTRHAPFLTRRFRKILAAIIVGVMGLIALGIVVFLSPRNYTAQAEFEVDNAALMKSGVSVAEISSRIRSQEVLYPMIENFMLAGPDDQEAMQTQASQLRDSLAVATLSADRPAQDDTSAYELTLTVPSTAVLAADLTNAIIGNLDAVLLEKALSGLGEEQDEIAQNMANVHGKLTALKAEMSAAAESEPEGEALSAETQEKLRELTTYTSALQEMRAKEDGIVAAMADLGSVVEITAPADRSAVVAELDLGRLALPAAIILCLTLALATLVAWVVK